MNRRGWLGGLAAILGSLWAGVPRASSEVGGVDECIEKYSAFPETERVWRAVEGIIRLERGKSPKLVLQEINTRFPVEDGFTRSSINVMFDRVKGECHYKIEDSITGSAAYVWMNQRAES